MNIFFKMIAQLTSATVKTLNRKEIDTEFLLNDGKFVPFKITSESGMFPIQFDKAEPADEESMISCIRYYVSNILKRYVKKELLDYGFWLTINNLKVVDLKVETVNSFGDLQLHRLDVKVVLEYKKSFTNRDDKIFTETFMFKGNKLSESSTLPPELWKVLTYQYDGFIKIRSNIKVGSLSNVQLDFLKNEYNINELKADKFIYAPVMIARDKVDVLYLVNQPELGVFEIYDPSVFC